MNKQANTVLIQLKCVSVFLLIAFPFLFLAAFFPARPQVFFILNFFIGFLMWTYLEYHLHRFWTHKKNGPSRSLALQRHMRHHKHPTEIKVTRPHRMILFLISSVLFAVSLVWNNYFTIIAGLVIGFAYSFFSHWLLHQSWSIKVCPTLHRFHIHHHCKHPDSCFGFSTVFWDLIFKTDPPKNAQITERIIKFYYGNTQDGHHHQKK